MTRRSPTSTTLVLATALLCSAALAIAEDKDLAKGDSVLGFNLSYANPGGDAGKEVDPAPAVGVDYYYHITDRFGLGFGVTSYSFDGEKKYSSWEMEESEFQVVSLGPLARFVFNPDSPFRGYAGGGLTYNRVKYHYKYQYTGSNYPELFTYDSTYNKVGYLVAVGFEASLTEKFFLGAEARYGYFGSEDVGGESIDATGTSLSVRLGIRF